MFPNEIYWSTERQWKRKDLYKRKNRDKQRKRERIWGRKMGLVWFYILSTIVGYLSLIHFYSYKLLFQTIQFSIIKEFSSIYTIGRTQSDATTLGQTGLGSHRNKGILRISQSSRITGVLPFRLFSVILTTLVWGVLPLSRDAVGVLYSPSRLGQK